MKQAAHPAPQSSSIAPAKPARKRKRQPWPQIRPGVNNGARVYIVDGRIRGKGKRYVYATKVEAEAKAEKLRITRTNEGASGLAVPEKLRMEATEAMKLLEPLGVSLTAAVKYYLTHSRPEGGAKTVTDLADEFLREKKSAGRRPEYLRVQKYVLKRLKEAFGARAAHELRPAEIGEWLKIQTWAPRTKLNYFRDISNLYGFAIRRGYTASNPMDRLEEPKVNESGAPGILTPKQVGALLTAAEARDKGSLTSFVAIGCFAGLRTSELLKLEWKDIDLDEDTIAVAPHVSKTREHRYVTISDNLKAWLMPHVKDGGLVRPSAWRYHFEAARRAAGILAWPDNAMRHSFGSYHYAHHKNAALTAAELGHRSTTQTLFRHYRALAKPKDAAAFWSILPSLEAEKKVLRIG